VRPLGLTTTKTSSALAKIHEAAICGHSSQGRHDCADLSVDVVGEPGTELGGGDGRGAKPLAGLLGCWKARLSRTELPPWPGLVDELPLAAASGGFVQLKITGLLGCFYATHPKYERHVSLQWTFTALPSQIRIQDDAIDDGIFPLITNHPQTELNAREVLAKYKYQPFIEKRHEQMKTVFDVAPVNFKLPYRIEALMFIYFVVLAINALIERDIRRAMKAQSTESLPLYPEARRCRNPTTERIITLFRGQRRHILKRHGQEVKTFVDDLSPVHRTVLELLEVPPSAYEQ
jgi:hypothetical protein